MAKTANVEEFDMQVIKLLHFLAESALCRPESAPVLEKVKLPVCYYDENNASTSLEIENAGYRSTGFGLGSSLSCGRERKRSHLTGPTYGTLEFCYHV